MQITNGDDLLWHTQLDFEMVNINNRCISNDTFINQNQGAQLLSGRVLDSRPRGGGFEPHRHHCVVSMSKTHHCLLLKTCPNITEKLLTGA